jgi:Ca2+-transporting ATPase
MALSLILTLMVIYVPALAGVFSLEALTVRELAVALGLSISIIPIVEIVKAIQRTVEKSNA